MNGDQIPPDSVHDRLKDGDSLVAFDGDVEDEASHAGNGHGDDDRRPAVEEDIVDERVAIGEVKAKWCDDEEENARYHGWG